MTASAIADPTLLDATELAASMAGGGLSCVAVMAAFLDRIGRINPSVNALVSVRRTETLMAEARAADEATGPRGPLHGFPFAIKDLVETAGIRTTHGSPIHADHVPEVDDLLAARLRAAGAILIGKTNTPEFGLGSHSFNPVHGVTRNPYELSLSAGGSSGGAAAALAARLVPLADGSDSMGSLRNPAAFCNVYGFRPSLGVVPRDPVGDLFLNQMATDGPMARSVRDLALLLDVIAGPAPHDPHAMPASGSFLVALDTPAPPGRLRIGWLGDWSGVLPVEPGIIELCQPALGVFEALGHTIEPLPAPFDMAALTQAWRTLRSFHVAGSKRVLHADAATRGLLKPELVYEIERGLALDPMAVHDASVVRTAWFTAVAHLFADYDVLVLPSAQVFPFPVQQRWPQMVAGRTMTTYHQWMEVVVPASIAGLPTLNVPVGFSDTDLPMGMQLIGPRGGDVGVLRLGEAYHRETQWPQRRPPRSPA